MWTWFKRIGLMLILFLAVSQTIRPARTNPPIDPKREIHGVLPVDPDVVSIFSRSCNDCHSNRTVWPWYSQVAPLSWLVAYDVRQGRRKMNFSEWESLNDKNKHELLKEICSDVSEGEMPGWGYSLMHPQAKISGAEAQAVCSWTRQASQTLSAFETKTE